MSILLPQLQVSETAPRNCLVMIGQPKLVVLAPGQKEPTLDQMVQAYVGAITMMKIDGPVNSSGEQV